MQGDEDLVCVSVICPSTGRQYIIRAPPTMSDCRQAVAWIAEFDDPDDYREPSAIKRRIHCWLTEGSPLAGELGVRPTSFESRIYWEILQRWNEQRIGRGSRLSGL